MPRHAPEHTPARSRSVRGHPNHCDLASLPSGHTDRFQLVVTVNSDRLANISNSASVASATSDPNTSNNSQQVTTQVTTSADISVQKTGPASLDAGLQAAYDVTITDSSTANNTSTDTARIVK